MRIQCNCFTLACGLALGIAVASQAAKSKSNEWSLDVSLYGLAAGMSGDVVVRGIPADLNVDFDQILDNLNGAFMGTVRIGHDRWVLTADVVYMELAAENNGVSAAFDQWMIEPTLGYMANEQTELFAGVRYNNLSGELRGPLGRNPSGTQDWYDPVIGSAVHYPITKTLGINFRGDIGGFGVGSDLTWQAFPYLDWSFAQWGSVEAGYRWLYTDYEDGSGVNRFAYQMLTQGPQLGITAHF